MDFKAKCQKSLLKLDPQSREQLLNYILFKQPQTIERYCQTCQIVNQIREKHGIKYDNIEGTRDELAVDQQFRYFLSTMQQFQEMKEKYSNFLPQLKKQKATDIFKVLPPSFKENICYILYFDYLRRIGKQKGLLNTQNEYWKELKALQPQLKLKQIQIEGCKGPNNILCIFSSDKNQKSFKNEMEQYNFVKLDIFNPKGTKFCHQVEDQNIFGYPVEKYLYNNTKIIYSYLDNFTNYSFTLVYKMNKKVLQIMQANEDVRSMSKAQFQMVERFYSHSVQTFRNFELARDQFLEYVPEFQKFTFQYLFSKLHKFKDCFLYSVNAIKRFRRRVYFFHLAKEDYQFLLDRLQQYQLLNNSTKASESCQKGEYMEEQLKQNRNLYEESSQSKQISMVQEGDYKWRYS